MAGFKEFKVRWGMVIDLDKCDGCGDCILACQAENNIPPGQDPDDKFRSLNWLAVYEMDNGEKYPKNETAYILRPCMQCGFPPCVSVCPVIATEKNEEGGIVSQIYPRCIGCRYCMAACPYHARYFNWHDPVWPEGMEKTLSPTTSVRPRGVVEKCSFCHHRFMYAKDANRVAGKDPLDIEDGQYTTACSDACTSGAIKFGDLNNPDHEVYHLAQSKYAFRLLERLNTAPQVYYISEREWIRRQGDNYLEGEEMPEHGAHGGGHGGGDGGSHNGGHDGGHDGGSNEGGIHHG